MKTITKKQVVSIINFIQSVETDVEISLQKGGGTLSEEIEEGGRKRIKNFINTLLDEGKVTFVKFINHLKKKAEYEKYMAADMYGIGEYGRVYLSILKYYRLEPKQKNCKVTLIRTYSDSLISIVTEAKNGEIEILVNGDFIGKLGGDKKYEEAFHREMRVSAIHRGDSIVGGTILKISSKIPLNEFITNN